MLSFFQHKRQRSQSLKGMNLKIQIKMTIALIILGMLNISSQFTVTAITCMQSLVVSVEQSVVPFPEV